MIKFLLFSQLAFKNLRRFRRRTLLVGLTVILCAAVLVFNNSLGNGIEDQLLKNLVTLQTGHLQLTPQPTETSGGAPIYRQTLLRRSWNSSAIMRTGWPFIRAWKRR